MASKQRVPSDQVYFSQHGEDLLLSRLFASQNDGFFIEIGCIDGRRYSNSLRFEYNGWVGLCVEAHSDYIQLLERNRPGSIVEHAAVGEKDMAVVEFYANSRGSLSSLDRNKAREFKRYGEYFTGFEVQNVPMLTLNTIFKKHAIESIDFLSLDIEGYEVQALRGIDLSVYHPKVFVIESDSEAHKQEIENILLPVGYHFITSLQQNLFYSLEENHREMIGNKTFENVHLVHTQHPLDNTGDVHKVITVLTARTDHTNAFMKMAKKALAIARSHT